MRVVGWPPPLRAARTPFLEQLALLIDVLCGGGGGDGQHPHPLHAARGVNGEVKGVEYSEWKWRWRTIHWPRPSNLNPPRNPNSPWLRGLFLGAQRQTRRCDPLAVPSFGPVCATLVAVMILIWILLEEFWPTPPNENLRYIEASRFGPRHLIVWRLVKIRKQMCLQPTSSLNAQSFFKSRDPINLRGVLLGRSAFRNAGPCFHVPLFNACVSIFFQLARCCNLVSNLYLL